MPVFATSMPLVSVVVPCRNRADWLRPTLDSILAQDDVSVECIVVDAASTDNTVTILKQYGARVRWVSEPDGGHADAINKGWRMARGDILAWLNADDLWVVPHAARTAVEYFKAHPDVELVYGDCGMVDTAGNVVGRSYLHEWDLAYAVEHCDHCIPQPAAFIRRAILEKVGWLDTAFVSKKDHELWPLIGLRGRIAHLPVTLAYERAIPGYMAARGDVTAAACVELTRKFFTLPGVPPELRVRRRRALSNACLRGMEYAWKDGHHWNVVFAYALRSVLYDPRNAGTTYSRLLPIIRKDAPHGRRLRVLLALLRALHAPGTLK